MATQRKAKVTSLKEIEAVIEQHRPELKRQFHVDKIAVFGSFARGTQKKRSDVDFLVTFDESISLFALSGLHIYLQEQLGRKVDVVSRDNIRPELRKYILKDVTFLRDYSIYIKDILSNIRNASRFIGCMSFEEFTRDYKTNYAVARCLTIIGESSMRIPQRMRNKYPEIPWKTLIGTRNAIVHEHSAAGLAEAWKTAVNDFPPLKKRLKEILADLK
jgi:uncharacterized protein with HEPN domain/predicted nucleotidyltransferase